MHECVTPYSKKMALELIEDEAMTLQKIAVIDDMLSLDPRKNLQYRLHLEEIRHHLMRQAILIRHAILDEYEDKSSNAPTT